MVILGQGPPGDGGPPGGIPVDPPAPVPVVDCDQEGQTIQDSLQLLQPRDTLLVTGFCNENVVIDATFNSITLDGQDVATIDGPGPDLPTIRVRGTTITIRGFTNSGGRTGIQIDPVGDATINNNTIEDTGRDGIVVGFDRGKLEQLLGPTGAA